MILRRFYDDNLAQASYLVGCSATGEALVVDPNRDVAQYIEAAAREGLRITHVTETHIHADFVSGLRELCATAGATAYLSAAGTADWQYEFAAGDGAVLLQGGDSFKVGNILIETVHTPGHTPEHLTFMVTDTAGADRPMGAFTGDFIFAGDVGRPDLLEKAAGISGTMEAAARQLFASLQAFKKNADYLQLWPGHGAGSACGKALGAVPQTTLGYERMFNWAFTVDHEDAFVGEVLYGQPAPPRYFAEMKRVNRAGPHVLRGIPAARQLDPAALAKASEGGGVLLDIRPWNDFAREHIVGAINIPLNKSFTNWAGWIVPYGPPIHLIANDASQADRAVRDLAMIGLDNVAGAFGVDTISAQRDAGRTQASANVEVDDMAAAAKNADTTIIDVRNAQEWNEGHVPQGNGAAGARVLHIPLGELESRMSEVPEDGRIIVHCKAGGRSAIATSILEKHGRRSVENVRGGFDAWRAHGHPTSTDARPTD